MKFIFLFGLFNILNPLTHRQNSIGFAGLNFLGTLLKNLDSRPRIGLSIMLSMLIFQLLPSTMALDIRILAGWTSGILFFLTLVYLMMSSASSKMTCDRAQRQEAQPLAVFLLVVITACTSIFAIGLMQANNKNIPEPELAIEVGLSLLAIICSWFLTHTSFALYYATCYYRRDNLSLDKEYTKGIDFPGEGSPDYWDFMYFAFTLGMTAQTSDVSITSIAIRQLVLGHGLVSFFFYMVIIASSVNVASGLI